MNYMGRLLPHVQLQKTLLQYQMIPDQFVCNIIEWNTIYIPTRDAVLRVTPCLYVFGKENIWNVWHWLQPLIDFISFTVGRCDDQLNRYSVDKIHRECFAFVYKSGRTRMAVHVVKALSKYEG